MVGRDGLHAAARHGHGREGFESCHPQEGNQGTGNVLAHAAAVGVIHLQVVQGESFTFPHGDSRITDVVCHPVGQHGDFLHLGLLAANQFVYLLLGFRNGSKAAVVFIDAIEPARLLFPVGSGRHHQLRCGVIEIHHVRFAAEGHDFVFGEGVDFPSVLVAHGGGTVALVELELDFFFGRKADAVHFPQGRLGSPEGYDVVELPAHRGNET